MRIRSSARTGRGQPSVRKRIVLIALLGVAVPSVALATSKFKATFALSYLSLHTGVSSGLTTFMTWSDPAAPGGVPKVIKQITLRFPGGTLFDTSALPTCSASDTAIKRIGASACPAASKLGAGTTVGAARGGVRFNTLVALFNAPGKIIVLVTLNGAPITEFRDTVQRSAIIVHPVLPPGVSLERLFLRVGPHSSGHGHARKAYMRTPSSCPKSGRWKIISTFRYADSSSETLTSTTPCRPN